jgi:predicted ATPase
VFAEESVSMREVWQNGEWKRYHLGAGHQESKLLAPSGHSVNVTASVRSKMQVWRQYHFHDTSDLSPMKAMHGVNDNLRFKPNGSNLGAYLRKLKIDEEESYQRIVGTIRRAAPFFGDFVFRNDASESIQLEWTERGLPDTPWKGHVLSDGTLRFICLTTLLQQPARLMPDTILIDEPELGLHPFAINLLADMLKEAAENKQVIVSTQSVELLNAFSPDDVIVVQREQDETTFKRLNANDLADWLVDDYSLGDLWKRNIFGGRPTR